MTTEQQAVHDDFDLLGQNEFTSPTDVMGNKMDDILIAEGFPSMGQDIIDYFNDWQINYTPTDWVDLMKWVWGKIKELAEWLWDQLND